MKQIFQALFILSAYLFFTGCNPNAVGDGHDHDHDHDHDHGTEIPDPILPGEPGSNPLESKEVMKKKCQGEASCAEVQAKYLWATGYPQAVNDSINAYVTDNLLMTLGVDSEEEPKDIESAAQAFVDEYLNDIAGMEGESPLGWEAEITSSILQQNTKALCLSIDSYTFLGGAHGNGHSDFQTFDISTGKKIDLASLISDKEKFMSLLDAEFRKEYELEAGTSLIDAGFDTDELPLPDNMGLGEDGLMMHYNTYEIAPYSGGPSSVVIPREKLNGLFDLSSLE
jgi:hypothetical protein